jgi:hypothetical protein
MSDLMITTLDGPGIYPGVEAARYHALEAASNSRLSRLLRSPAHLREYLDNPPSQTDDMLLGSAAHALILEPESFAGLYQRAPEGDRRAKAVKDAWAELEARHPFATLLKPDHYDACQRMRDAVLSHEAASYLVGAAGDVEVSLLWDDPATAVRCKGRPDKLAGSLGVVVDLKTTQNASAEEFTRSVHNFGYFRQGAMYLDGLAECGVQVQHFVIIAVEKTPPFGVAVYRLREDAIEAGRKQLRSLLHTYRWCMERGEWPCYPETIQDLSLPRWAWSSIESEG